MCAYLYIWLYPQIQSINNVTFVLVCRSRIQTSRCSQNRFMLSKVPLLLQYKRLNKLLLYRACLPRMFLWLIYHTLKLAIPFSIFQLISFETFLGHQFFSIFLPCYRDLLYIVLAKVQFQLFCP